MKQIIKSSFKKIPYAYTIKNYLKFKYEYFKYKRMSVKDVFCHIHRRKLWGNINSVSGPGSSLEETKTLRDQLPALFLKYCVTSFLDIPCGDFHWMKTINFGNIEYIGADIVPEIVEQNKRYKNKNITFEQLDIIRDILPTVDLIMVRDCLVHFAYEDIFKTLDNICKYGAKYLLTTTFNERTSNTDIATGQWRPLNLQISPFNLPEPQTIINERYSENKWKDKSLGLWKIEDIMELKGNRFNT